MVVPITVQIRCFAKFCVFQKIVENLFDRKIKYFQSDGGLEFDNSPLKTHLDSCGISFRKSCPHTQAQNGVTERKHCHLVEMTRTFLIRSNIPTSYWVDAVYAAVYTTNQLPTLTLENVSPFQKLFGRVSDYGFLRTFGLSCFPLLPPIDFHKL